MSYHPRFLTAVALAASALLPAAATAQTNLALGKATFASSVYQPGFSDPSRAVDGNTNGDYNVGSVFHSGSSTNPFWYVDLGATYDISSIVFYNRTDGGFGARIVGSTLGIFSSAPYGTTPAVPVQSFAFTTADAMQTFTAAAGTRGRYVGIQNPTQYLQIAELQVFGSQGAPVSTVPEPSTWVLLASGLGALGVTARRRRGTLDS